MNIPIISVVLGSFNRISYLRKTIQSVREELKDFAYEIIIIDGGSTDGSLKWLSEQKDILLIIQHNRGYWNGKPLVRRSWGYFMNLGFKIAQGKYICMLSDDCLVIPGAIRNGYQLFEEKLKTDEKIGAIAFYFRDWPTQEKYHICCTPANYLYVNHGLYLNQAIKEVGYIDEDNYQFYGADTDLCLRMRSIGYKIIESPYSFIEHYAHANTKVRNSNEQVMSSDLEAQHRIWHKIMMDEQTGLWRASEIIEKKYFDSTNTIEAFKKLHKRNLGGIFNHSKQQTKSLIKQNFPGLLKWIKQLIQKCKNS
jgi:GT2 family glycosyltransferase